MKKLMTVVLALLLATGTALAVTPPVQTYECGQYTYILLADGTAQIVCWDGPEAAVDVPGTLDGVTVTSISECAFADCPGLERVSLPATVREIGESAFSNCTSLQAVTLPEGLRRIGATAFDRCQLLTAIDLPGSLAEVGDNPFRGCTNLCFIRVSADNPWLAAEDNVLFTRSDHRLVCYPMGKSDKRYQVPEGVVTVGAMAFDGGMYVEEIVLPESLREIGREAFNGCESLRAMNLPAGVQSIGESAMRCSNLVLTIEDDATCVPQLV